MLGSHIDARMTNGNTRQYSLCNSPQERPRYIIGMLKDSSSGGGSIAMHEKIEVGQVISISEPRDLFLLEDLSKKHLLFVAGIAITPMLAMPYAPSARDADFEVHYCLRSFDHEGDQPFRGELAISRQALQIPAERSAFEVLDEAGIAISSSCEQGICGYCIMRVLQGVPDHRDQCMTPSEQARNNQFTPCCSRSKSARPGRMSTSVAAQLAYEIIAVPSIPTFPLNQRHFAALSNELNAKPVDRTRLGKPFVIFCAANEQVAALEVRCCDRALPSFIGTLGEKRLRCGYHCLFLNREGQYVQIPSQDKIPSKAESISGASATIWFRSGLAIFDIPIPICGPPEYDKHSGGKYIFDGSVNHYDAPYL